MENEKLIELSTPLMEYLREKYNPHCKIIVEHDRVEITEAIIGIPL